MSIKRALYSLLLYLLFPLVILRLFWRSRSNPAYRQRIFERLGLVKIKQDKPIIWLHAVSVGETIAAKPLIEALLEQHPDYRLLVTTTTPTGSDQVKSLFSERVDHFYYPYDLPEIIYRFLNRVKPKILIVMETEIWPNLYAVCYKRQIPIVIVNARLSERSTQSYLKIRGLIAETLSHVSTIAVRSKQDAERFKLLGASDKRLTITGNIKFDIELDQQQIALGKTRKQAWGVDRPVWVAASTHEGEDSEILTTYINLLTLYSDLILVLIPRHPERFEPVFQLCQDLKTNGITSLRHSEIPSYNNLDANIIVGDSMGEMHGWFATADVVFIGGSLVEKGGHNPLEALIQGVPVVSGPYMFNFHDIVSALNSKVLTVCKDRYQIEKTVAELLDENNSRIREEAAEIMQPLRGVTAQLMTIISTKL